MNIFVKPAYRRMITTNNHTMRLFKTLFIAASVALAAACTSAVKPADNDGHQLWFYSMDQDGMNLSSEKTTLAIAENEIREYWGGKQAVSFEVLDTEDDELGSEGYRIVFGD